MVKVILSLLLAVPAFGYTKNSPSSGFNSAATSAFGQPEYKDESVDLGTRYAELTLVSTAIKTLNTTPVLAVTSPGAGKALLPIAVYGTIDYRSATYVAPSNSGIDIEYGGSGSGEKVATLDWRLMEATADKAQFSLVTDGITPLANTGLWAHIDSSNPTGGDSDIVLRIYYKIVPMPLAP